MQEVKSDYSYDEETGLFTRKDTQHVDHIIKANREERNSGDNDRKGLDGRKFASVPVVVLEDLKQRLGIDYMLFGICPDTTVRLIRWLSDPANKAWRTSEANLGNGNRFVQ